MKTLSLIVFVGITLGAGAQANPCQALNGAEHRFAQPAAHWFYQTQEQLRREVQRVDAGLKRVSAEAETYWKNLFRWHLLEANLKPGATEKLGELELVRRWMFSNRKGIESPFFAPLREAMDAHLDAAFTFSHKDLRKVYLEKVALARTQCVQLSAHRSEANGVALGRTLGWFQRTRQIPDVVQTIEAQLSYANATVTVKGSIIQSFMADQLKPVSQSQPVHQTLSVPTGLLGGMRQTTVRGTASTTGNVSLRLVPNSQQAELQLVFQGQLDSRTQGSQGPVTTYSHTWGPVAAAKSLFLTGDGLRLGATAVNTPIHTEITGIQAPSRIVGRIAQRRANRPAVQASMFHQARQQASRQLSEQFTVQVETQFAQAQAQAQKMESNMDGFSDLLAPIAREGAEAHFHGSRTTAHSLEVQAMQRRVEQFGATTPCPQSIIDADVVGCVHQSYFNNMFETLMQGKTYPDTYFMEGAKVLQPELPLPLMVHSRAPHWAITVRKPRPMEVTLGDGNQVKLVMHLTGVTRGRENWEGTATLQTAYRLTKDPYGDYQMEREGDVVIEGDLSNFREFLQSKMDAFFAPILNGGGVIVPDGGILGTLKDIQNRGIKMQGGWLVVGIDLPAATLEKLKELQTKAAK